jgi:transposase
MSRTGTRAGCRLSVEEKTRIVPAVLAGEMTMAEAAGRHGTSPRAIGQWRDRFVDAGKASLESRMPGGPCRGGTQGERRPRAEAEQLKLALAEVTVQPRIWRKGAEYLDAVPSQTSKT